MRIALTILAVLLAAPAMAQPWEGYYSDTTERAAGMKVLVLDPTGEGRTRYRFMALEDLLRGAVDLRARYVAVKAAGESTSAAPAFTAADFAAGTSAPGAAGVPVPELPSGATAVWLGTAVPAGTAGAISLSGRGNITAIFRPGGEVEIGGRAYDVRVGWLVAGAATGVVTFGGGQ